MSYTIYNNNGSILINLPDGEVDSSTTSLSLVGKNVNNYGEYWNNNLIKLLTSFADTNQPINPREGQLYFNSNSKKLQVYDGSAFKPVYQSQVSGTPAGIPSDGDFWYDTINRQFKVFVSDVSPGEWRLVGPANSYTYGKIGIESPSTSTFILREDVTNASKNCSLIYSYGTIIGFLSSSTFVANTSTSQYYFNTSTATRVNTGTTILKSITARENLYVEGDMYLKGEIFYSPNRKLTTYYDRTWIGSSLTDSYTATNNWIRLEILPYLFSTGTESTALLSEARVLTSYNTQTEVRHYRLEERVGGVKVWEAYEIYNTTGTNYWGLTWAGNTTTNVVQL
jgi:hypothetical protein